jgi:Gpi18-like mannosyltransferase
MFSFLENPSKQKIIAFSVLGALFLYACIILALSSGTFDSGDGIAHYVISRYSWHHFHLFLDDWGKPIFTMASSPFAQFGLKGITFFNILCGLGASFIAFKIAERLAIPFPYLALIFTFSAPIYFSVVNSGLTEPLFSFLLIGCIWLVMNKRFYLSAIVFSFLPFVRADFIYVIPLFFIYYILKKKYWAILLLPLGTVIISILGFFYYKNILWLISQNPYNDTNSKTYGDVHGSYFSYIGQYNNITGKALALLIILGIIWFAGVKYLKKFRTPKEANPYAMEEFLLVFGCFIFILAGHTIVWANGIYPTLGMARYMCVLIPLGSIVALRGLQLLNTVPDLLKMPRVKVIIACVFAIGVLYSPYALWYKIPFQLDDEETVIKKATDWLKQTSYAKEKIYYIAPYVAVCMDIDPFDITQSGIIWDPISQYPMEKVPVGSVMIWDSHFGPNEGNVKLDTIYKRPFLTFLNKFSPDKPFQVIGGMDYGIWIFRKTKKAPWQK